jgi:hypothetical protein
MRHGTHPNPQEPSVVAIALLTYLPEFPSIKNNITRRARLRISSGSISYLVLAITGLLIPPTRLALPNQELTLSLHPLSLHPNTAPLYKLVTRCPSLIVLKTFKTFGLVILILLDGDGGGPVIFLSGS